MARTFRRCTQKKTRHPKALSKKALPEEIRRCILSEMSEKESRRYVLSDDSWLRRFWCTDIVKKRTVRTRRMRERLLPKVAEPSDFVLPENEKRNYLGDSIF